MLTTIENECLRLTVSDHGAEMWELSEKAKPDVPLLWDGKKEHWPRRAPLLFPWCGRVEENWYEVNGKRYENLPQHGFVRDMDHKLAAQAPDSLTYRLDFPGDDTRWPWAFSFETTHSLVGNKVVTVCTGKNESDSPMPAQLGFHAGLSCPFTPGKRLEDYFVRFEQPESLDGTCIFPLDHHTFDNDSICFPGLRSKWLQVEERDTGRALRVETEGFPFVLLWSALGVPDYVCIEPWTGFLGPGHDLIGRPGTRLLAPGETLSKTHTLIVDL